MAPGQIDLNLTFILLARGLVESDSPDNKNWIKSLRSWWRLYLNSLSVLFDMRLIVNLIKYERQNAHSWQSDFRILETIGGQVACEKFNSLYDTLWYEITSAPVTSFEKFLSASHDCGIIFIPQAKLLNMNKIVIILSKSLAILLIVFQTFSFSILERRINMAFDFFQVYLHYCTFHIEISLFKVFS